MLSTARLEAFFRREEDRIGFFWFAAKTDHDWETVNYNSFNCGRYQSRFILASASLRLIRKSHKICRTKSSFLGDEKAVCIAFYLN